MAVVAAAFGFTVAGLITRKYMLVKHTSVMRFLSIFAWIMVASLAADPIFFAITRNLTTQEMADSVIQIQTSFSFAGTALANIVLICFLKSIFYEGRSKLWMRAIVVIELGVAILMPVLAFAVAEPLYVLVLHAFASIIIYIFQAIRAFAIGSKLKREKSTDVASINGITLIGLSGVLLISTFCAFIMQEIAFVFKEDFLAIGLIDNLGCSLFVAIGFVLAVVSLFVLYVGYYVPSWIKKRWQSGT